jgi:hypothetical protein
MREQHDTKLVEQAIRAISERLEAPVRQLQEASDRKTREVEAQTDAAKRSAEAAARGSILQAEGWKAFRILSAAALVILALGFAGRLILSTFVDREIVAVTPSVAPLPATSAPTIAPNWPPIPTASETAKSGNNVVTTNYTLFRKATADLGSRNFEVTAGHDYRKETDTNFSRAWCYIDVAAEGVNLTVTLGTKAPGHSPEMTDLTPAESEKSGLSQTDFRTLFARCPWIDGNPDISMPMSNVITYRYEGDVTKESVDALVNAIAKGATKIELSSPGGQMGEGIRGYEAIRNAGATTVVTGECASACTILFLGGIDRSVEAGGRIGVHQWRSESGAASEVEAQEVSANLLSIFAAAGVSEQFFIAGASTVPSEIRWLTQQELTEWRVVSEG